MDEYNTNLPTSHLLGSVPAVINEEKGKSPTNYEAPVPEANMQIFPPTNGGDRGGRGYQTIQSPSEGFEQQPADNWKGLFSISSYMQYFNVDSDIVLNRLLSSLHPTSGDFFNKIEANPDLYGLVWISTTLVFALASLGNCATYLMEKHTDKTSSWSFNVGYVNSAACAVYGYAAVVPLAFYFLLQYMGSYADLVRFWCLWGYSLFIFVPASFLLLIPSEILRWIVIIVTGAASASFVSLNLKSKLEHNDLTLVVVAACFLQLALAVFIKVWFFP